MINYATIFLIAIALSMDAFSIALTIGINNKSMKKQLLFILGVGLCHFFFPLIGIKLGQTILVNFIINSSKILGIILLFLASQMIFEKYSSKAKVINYSYTSLALLIISVSLDSLLTGIGLYQSINSYFLILIIFSITSSVFSASGIFLGKQFSKLIGKYSELIGIIILIVLGVKFLLF